MRNLMVGFIEILCSLASQSQDKYAQNNGITTIDFEKYVVEIVSKCGIVENGYVAILQLILN